MAQSPPQESLDRLEASVDFDAGSPAFPALAEAYRLAGRHADAERVARDGLEKKPGSLEGVLVLALVLMDQGQTDEAREELLRVSAELVSAVDLALPESPGAPQPDSALDFEGDVSEAELDVAFDGAETDPDEVLDANRVAQEAIRLGELASPEDVAPSPDSAFATRTMAELLERQGDHAGASRIRTALAAESAPPQEGASDGEGERIIATLEGWLANLRGERT